MKTTSHYEILGVAEAASAEQIKFAYRVKVLEHHPDRNPGNRAAGERTKLVIEAHAVLFDAVRRAEYDKQLRAERARADTMAALRAFQEAHRRAPHPTAPARPVVSSLSPEQAVVSKLVEIGLTWLFTPQPRRARQTRTKIRARYDPNVDRFRGPDGRFRPE